MSADAIIYCLENLTDYMQFERLCSDLMAGVDFPNIEPIGGTGDRGRDALHTCKYQGTKSVFAYTVRTDWFTKLKSDCSRIHEEDHNPDNIIYVCTSNLSGSDRDKAEKYILEKYAWSLEIYDIERIRVLLTGPLNHLVAKHPAIFCPPWFPQSGGLSVSECRDTLIIDHVAEDHALATWLSRKLSLAGYKTWCFGTAPLAGEDIDSSVQILIKNRAVQYLPILSVEALANTDFITRASLACSVENLMIPCWSEDLSEYIDSSRQIQKILQLEPARFGESWASGIDKVSLVLQVKGIKPELSPEQGKMVAIRAYIPEPVTKLSPEKVYANVFPVEVPKAILICELDSEMSNEDIDILRQMWAFVKISSQKFLSFSPPPDGVPLKRTPRIPAYSWSSYSNREGKNSINAVKELIRRSLEVACYHQGMKWCSDRRVIYFPGDAATAKHNISITHVDGRKTRVSMTGEKQYGWGDRATRFRYQLCPKFKPGFDENGEWWVTLSIYVRVTDLAGKPYELKDIIRRRKNVTKNWWNKEWLARTIGIMQALKSDSDQDHIRIGTDKHQVVVGTNPLAWECPVSIDVEAVDRIGNFQEEISSVKAGASQDDDFPSQSGEDS